MAFQTPVFFGYRVDSNLSDVINKNTALSNINLNINDLDVIRGVSSEEGATRFDFQAISRLEEDVYRTLDRFQGDTAQYEGILRESPGADIALRGNLNVNGRVGGSAIRYRKVSESNDDVNFLDISTSRVSAWSTTTNPPADTDPIFYGGEVQVVSGGKLEVSNLTFGTEAKPRLFDAEIPTNTITVNIDGTDYQFYAMKSIPLVFRGFFRRFNGDIQFTNNSNLRASWRVINVNDSSDTDSYSNVGTLTRSELRFRSVRAAERDIEFYYPPDNITSIELRGINLRTLPSTSLTNLNSLDVSFNDIKEIPDINKFAPNLSSLNIRNNPLYLSADEDFRKLNANVMARIPSSVTSLNMTSTFFGTVRTTGTPGSSPSVIEDRLPNLTSLELRGGFARDDFDPSAFLPTVPDSCVNYSVAGDFLNIPSTGVIDVSSLRTFNVAGNDRLSDSNFETNGFPNAVDLTTLRINSTNLRIPTLQNKTNLELIRADYTPSASLYLNDSQESTYKLLNCSSLRDLYIRRSGIGGFIPKFKGNSSFRFFHAWPAYNLRGGRPDGGEHGYSDGNTYVMYKDTFDDCRDTIEYFYVLSGRLLYERDFEPGTFDNLPRLRRLYWYSFGRTGGNDPNIKVPDVSSCPSLEFLNMPRNNFSGPVPSMVTNDRIRYINLSRNRLTGAIPEFSNRLRLYYINLRNNNLSSFPGFDSLPSLRFLYLHNNSNLTGPIPNLSEPSPNLRRIYLYNCNFTSYKAGSFAGLRRISRIILANNALGESDLNNIITDLHTMYQNTNRGRVRVNLRGQSRAPNYNPRSADNGGSSVEDQIRTYINTLRAAGWTITGVDG